MALKLKYKDEHGIVQINMSPTSTPKEPDKEITDPKFDTINNRFGQYDLFGGKYDLDSGGETPRSLFRSRYNSIEEELANTPYAFTTERSLRLNSANKLDITIQSRLNDTSPSKDIEDDRFFKRKLSLEYDESLFGPQIDFKVNEPVTPAFTVTQLIHAQDRYFDLSGRLSESPCSENKKCSEVNVPSSRGDDGAFKVLGPGQTKEAVAQPVVPTPKRKKESSFAILAETPVSRPTSPRSLPVDIRTKRVSPFRGRGFREETSRHNTPRTSAANSRANSPPRRRTNSLSRIDKMAQTAALPLPIHNLQRPPSPRNFLKENIEEVREISELNREKHEAEAEKKRIEEEEALLREMGLLDKSKSGSRSVVGSRTNSRSNSPNKITLRSRSNSPSAILHYVNIPTRKEYINGDDGMKQPVTHRSRLRSISKSTPQSNDGSPKHSKIPKRQSSVSPNRTGSSQNISSARGPVENNLNKNQRFISNSTSSINESIRIGGQVHDKRTSKSTQHLSIPNAHIRGKPPISPGRGGPPPTNKSFNTKRLSPIVGTPSKSPIDNLKPGSARTTVKPSPMPRKNAKTAGNTPATSRLTSRQPSRAISREQSPDKPNQRKTRPVTKPSTTTTKPVSRVGSTRTTQKPSIPKPEPKKKEPISRTNSINNLTKTPSMKNLAEKPPLKKTSSKKDLTEKSSSNSNINELGKRDTKKSAKGSAKSKLVKKTISTESMTDLETPKQDNETQYDKTNEEREEETKKNSELVILTKKNIISMTTAAITSQPLEVVTKVTNQLPTTFEKAREKGIFERVSSKESLAAKEDIAEQEKHEKEKHEKEKQEKEKPKEKDQKKQENKKAMEDEKHEEKRPPRHPKSSSNHESRPMHDDNIKLKPLQPHMYDNPQVERAKQKIEAILKEPEVSTENILRSSAKSRESITVASTNMFKNTFKAIANRKKSEIKEAKDETANKFKLLKDALLKEKEKEKMAQEMRSEATKIVDSIMTPVEQPKELTETPKEVPVTPKVDPVAPTIIPVTPKETPAKPKETPIVPKEAPVVPKEVPVTPKDAPIVPKEVPTPKEVPAKPKDIPVKPKEVPAKPKEVPIIPKDIPKNITEKAKEVKKDIIEPIVTVVNEKKKNGGSAIAEKVTEKVTLVKGEGEVEVQSSNVSTPGVEKMSLNKKQKGDGNGSDLSARSNGGLPQSTSTTPKPPARTKKEAKDKEKSPSPESQGPSEPVESLDPQETTKDPNFCQRLINKCKARCCTCCRKGEESDEEKDMKSDETQDEETPKEKKGGMMSKLNCCKKKVEEELTEEEAKDIERAAGKASIEYENETEPKRPRRLRDVLCGCCGRRRRVADTGVMPRNVAESMSPAPTEEETGCCGRKKRVERRDSILSDRPPASCCNNRMCMWFRGMCRRHSEQSSSRRTSMFSKNKSMSPTLPPEDTRKKLDTTLVEHTSMMRGAIPVLPIALAYFCLMCNIVVPGLGTVFSGMFCLCFGIPRFGVHDGAKYRIGSFVINLIVGCGQLFTVLFCLVGWGWSIWWGVIMVKTSRKYRKLKREAEAAEAEAPPVTANNHTRA